MEIGSIHTPVPGLDTIRALHQTVVALRAALEQSKTEILELKSKYWPIDSLQDALTSLSIENHVLRQKIIDYDHNLEHNESSEPPKEEPGLEKYNSPKNVIIETDKSKIDDCTTHIEPQSQTEPIKTQLKDNTSQIIIDSSNVSKTNRVLRKTDILKPQSDTAQTTSSDDVSTDLRVTESTKLESQLNKEHIEVEDEKVSSAPKVTKKVSIVSPKLSPKKIRHERFLEAKITVRAERLSPQNRTSSRSLESLTTLKSALERSKKLSFTKTVSFSNLPKVTRELIVDEKSSTNMSKNDSNAPEVLSPQNDLDQEVDDIELIFTTDDTKDSDFKEQLVSIDSFDAQDNENMLQLPLSDFDQADVSDRELYDEVFNETQENNSNNNASSKRNNSIYNSKSDNSINHEENKSLKSYYSSYQDSSFENKSIEKDESFDRFEERVRIVETDISKCGIHEIEYLGGRRNTCPNPIQYRPLSHRDALSKGLNSRKCRPILTHSNAMRKDSGAQTDISALPGSSWRSESSLANKVRLGDHFTTLPSKFPLPGSRLRLSEKTTVEARRVLLSDIGFTSMVPELSRSADYLCPPNPKPPTVTTYGQFLKTTDLYSPGYTSQKFMWTTTTASPSDGSRSQSRYSSIYPLTSPPAPSRRCSAPVSPSRRANMRNVPSKVRFANGSLPELRGDWTTTVDSGDSTDSLVEEAENYLRRSIDCLGTGRDITFTYNEAKQKSSVPRRASAPEPDRDNTPPSGWQPFLPRLPRDLKLDHWVKVITIEGRVRGGRVRYVGPVMAQAEQFVGVQLSNPDGSSDGTYSGRRYFQCEPYHGIFVPFKKVIMGWRP